MSSLDPGTPLKCVSSHGRVLDRGLDLRVRRRLLEAHDAVGDRHAEDPEWEITCWTQSPGRGQENVGGRQGWLTRIIVRYKRGAYFA